MPTSGPVDWVARLDEAQHALAPLLDAPPEVGVVLGSGLGAFADRLSDARSLPFAEVPHLPRSSVVGHAGRIVAGRCNGVRTVVLQGRVHAYEGYDAAEQVFPVRLLCRLGVKALVLTNAAGCIEPGWAAGDLMRITDHLNLSGRNPLVGPNDARLGPRFPDLSRVWDPRLALALEAVAAELRLPLRAGVYACVLGPSYETPAEIRMLRTLGGHAVGMSTVSEAIAAAHMGVPVSGISCLTNMAAGILDQPLSHAEVTETADRVRDSFVALLEAFLPRALAAVA
jgi:purine-nucleoside phosphorylase